MSPDKELKIACWLAGILLLVAVVCYAMPEKEPEKPVRKMFKCLAGKVLFTHQEHFSDYGVACADCHHHNEEDESAIRECGDCHAKEASQTVPKVCLDCHEPGEAHHDNEEVAELACKDCHTPAEEESIPQACTNCHEEDEIEAPEMVMDFQVRTDAFHNQCTKCHKGYGSGPLYIDADCSKCHVK